MEKFRIYAKRIVPVVTVLQILCGLAMIMHGLYFDISTSSMTDILGGVLIIVVSLFISFVHSLNTKRDSQQAYILALQNGVKLRDELIKSLLQKEIKLNGTEK